MPIVWKSTKIQEIIPTIEEINLFLSYQNQWQDLESELESLGNKKSTLIMESKAKNYKIPWEMRVEIYNLDVRIDDIKMRISSKKKFAEDNSFGSSTSINKVEIWEKVVPFLNQNAEVISSRIVKITKNAEKEPIKLNASLWIYKDFSYKVENSGLYTDEQFKLLIMEDFDKERRKFERLSHKFSTGENNNNIQRPRIPENVRVEVWRRDGGKCARCGSRENLEYDHIVPVSKGGSNTARNIELLCEKCNRSKGAEIA